VRRGADKAAVRPDQLMRPHALPFLHVAFRFQASHIASVSTTKPPARSRNASKVIPPPQPATALSYRCFPETRRSQLRKGGGWFIPGRPSLDLVRPTELDDEVEDHHAEAGIV